MIVRIFLVSALFSVSTSFVLADGTPELRVACGFQYGYERPYHPRQISTPWKAQAQEQLFEDASQTLQLEDDNVAASILFVPTIDGDYIGSVATIQTKNGKKKESTKRLVAFSDFNKGMTLAAATLRLYQVPNDHFDTEETFTVSLICRVE